MEPAQQAPDVTVHAPDVAPDRADVALDRAEVAVVAPRHAEPLVERLRARGWRMTAQRRAIAEVMTGEHVHLAADEVFDRARAALPEVSLATVYNTLRELVDMGELLELAHADGRKRYDPNVAESHHHLVCVDCGRMLDVRADDPRLPVSEHHGFELLGVEVTFRARCPDCLEVAPAPRRVGPIAR